MTYLQRIKRSAKVEMWSPFNKFAEGMFYRLVVCLRTIFVETPSIDDLFANRQMAYGIYTMHTTRTTAAPADVKLYS